MTEPTKTDHQETKVTGGFGFGFRFALGWIAALVVVFVIVPAVIRWAKDEPIVSDIRNRVLYGIPDYGYRSSPNPNDRLPPNWDVIRR